MRFTLKLCLFFFSSIIFWGHSGWSQNIAPKPIDVKNDGPYSTQCFSDFTQKSAALNIAIFEPSSLFQVPKHHKLEIGVSLPDQVIFDVHKYLVQKDLVNGLNPYNPMDIDCHIEFSSPSNQKIETYGFYYTPQIRNSAGSSWNRDTTSYPLRIRFAPNEIGTWCGWITLKVRTGEEYVEFNKTFSFTCIDSDHKGKLTKKGDQFYYSETNEQFINIGHTIAHSDYYNLSPKASEMHINWIKETGEAGANYLRLELSGRNGLPDFDNTQNYQTRQEEMWEFDKYVQTATDLGMYFTIFRHHIEVLDGADWDVVKWQNNSYQRDFDLETRLQYFTDSNVISQQQNTLRYIFARWGYTPNFAFYGYSEVNNWYKPLMESENIKEKAAEQIFADWLTTQFDFIRNETYWAGSGFACGYTGSYAYQKLKESKTIPLCDIVAPHHYGDGKEVNFMHRYDYVENIKKSFPNKPIQIQEIGLSAVDLYCCTNIEFHNTIWSTSFMSIMGPGVHWWWDRGINDQQYYHEYNSLRGFFEKFKDIHLQMDQSQKWTNSAASDMYKASIANYTLLNTSQTMGLGWVHNPSNYWRNVIKDSACINDLVEDHELNEDNKCNLEDGSVLGNGSGFEFEADHFKDYYTNHLSELSSSFYGETFQISHLQNNLNQLYNPWAKRHWYRVKFYSTSDTSFEKPIGLAVVGASAIGKISPNIPTLENETMDFVYIIEYLGKSKKSPK